ncbi:MAG: hypothetical protein ACI9LM_004729 [Alteromonadaceae bacterium]|jgi:hypothetical protein
MVSNVKRKNCVTKLHGVIFSLVVIVFSITSQAHAVTSENFLNHLKKHYQATNMIDTFSISYLITHKAQPYSIACST